MISVSPYGDKFEYSVDPAREIKKIDDFARGRKVVTVQGLGFVGSAMVAALSVARNERDDPIFNVLGVDMPDENNYWKIARMNQGKPPAPSADKNINAAYENGLREGNLLATYSNHAYSAADVVVVAVHLDVEKEERGMPYKYAFTYEPFKKAIESVASNISENALLVIETTVPPGTTEKIVYPIIKEAFCKRKLDINKLYLAYSYERVMPGLNCLDSITNFYRVYSGINKKSGEKAKDFFDSFINTKDYPLYEMRSTVAAEMAKVLENSFRATNIAFIQEWTEYAQRSNVDLFEVIAAIRMRPTHKNIMSPGFGVGGYCLTKDSMLADWSLMNLFGEKKHLEMSLNSIAINDMMPEYTFKLLKEKTGILNGRHVTILGISYLNSVADTRYSPAEYFYNRCIGEGALINLHDPLVNFWREKNITIETDINFLRNKAHEIAVFTVQHSEYMSMKCEDILSLLPGVKFIMDANNIINDDVAGELSKKGVDMTGVGKGHWKTL